MMTTRELVLAMRQKDPEMQIAKIAKLVGVSRQRVDQILKGRPGGPHNIKLLIKRRIVDVSKCFVCGTDDELSVHFHDGDRRSREPENIASYCTKHLHEHLKEERLANNPYKKCADCSREFTMAVPPSRPTPGLCVECNRYKKFREKNPNPKHRVLRFHELKDECDTCGRNFKELNLKRTGNRCERCYRRVAYNSNEQFRINRTIYARRYYQKNKEKQQKYQMKWKNSGGGKAWLREYAKKRFEDLKKDPIKYELYKRNHRIYQIKRYALKKATDPDFAKKNRERVKKYYLRKKKLNLNKVVELSLPSGIKVSHGNYTTKLNKV